MRLILLGNIEILRVKHSIHTAIHRVVFHHIAVLQQRGVRRARCHQACAYRVSLFAAEIVQLALFILAARPLQNGAWRPNGDNRPIIETDYRLFPA